jgi:hypothetical protein
MSKMATKKCSGITRQSGIQSEMKGSNGMGKMLKSESSFSDLHTLARNRRLKSTNSLAGMDGKVRLVSKKKSPFPR